jgi:hypothetical protein
MAASWAEQYARPSFPIPHRHLHFSGNMIQLIGIGRGGMFILVSLYLQVNIKRSRNK